MKELSDKDIRSEVDAIMKRIERIVRNIDALSPRNPPLPDEPKTSLFPCRKPAPRRRRMSEAGELIESLRLGVDLVGLDFA